MKIKKVCGLGGSGFEHFIVKLIPFYKTKIFFVLSDEKRVDVMADNIIAYADSIALETGVFVFPLSDVYERIKTLKNIADSFKKITVFLSTFEAVSSKTYTKEEFAKKRLRIKCGNVYSEIAGLFSEAGYKREEFVEDMGSFAVRGEIVDIWPVLSEKPMRLVLNGNLVEEIKTFSPDEQISIEEKEQFEVLPANEINSESIVNWLPPDSVAFLDTSEHSYAFVEKYGHLFSTIYQNTPLSVSDESLELGYQKNSFYGGKSKLLLEDLKKLEGYKKVLFYTTQGESKRFIELFGVDLGFKIIKGPLSEGFVNHKEKIFTLSTSQFFLNTHIFRDKEYKKPSRRTEGLWEISSGDYVVHENYGVGKYIGISLQEFPLQEFVELEYKHGDRLFVAITEFSRIKKYQGVEGLKPKLADLDAPHLWNSAKLRANRSAENFAKELLKLYALRETISSQQMSEDTIWEKELAESFPYEETADQKSAIDDVMKDLKMSRPADRLILGDVGFGKTEVALRAAFKSVCNSLQVAIIVPTTILAMQHYNRFKERLALFPINIEPLHRFQKKSEQKKIIDGIKKGTVDITIATHRILSKDISFKNLGLLIIDEEHRFGVRQKEKIRHIKKNIHTLYMSATPIPRTLGAALNGIKDVSLIETPPIGRKPIETSIEPFSKERIKTAIYNEISRGGQVFYIYNKIEFLDKKLKHLADLLGALKCGIVHGKMHSKEIEKVLVDFYGGKLDCLIATTIVESGIDIPQVNTIIIDGAENFGLAQLYQLRGRVGRKNQKAYCYLFYDSKDLTESAVERLEALREFSVLGSGYNLARRDLEIRGAGSLFGYRQHGFLSAVGFDLYTKMLSDAVKNLKSSEKSNGEEFVEPSIDISYPAIIPKEYINQDNIRISFYRRFVSSKTDGEVDFIVSELKDRFGKLPESVSKVVSIAKFKVYLRQKGISEVKETADGFEIRFCKGIAFGESGLKKMISEIGKDIHFMTERRINVKSPPHGKDKIIFLKEMLEKILEFATMKLLKNP